MGFEAYLRRITTVVDKAVPLSGIQTSNIHSLLVSGMLTGIRFHMKDFNSTGFPLHKINKFLQGILEPTGRVALVAFRLYGFYSIRIDKPSVGPCTVGMVWLIGDISI